MLAAHAAEAYTDAERKRGAAFRFASAQGASLREISAATGVPHATVSRIIGRAEPD